MGEDNIIPAKYLEQKILDYQGNPLIEALPPIYLKYDVMKLLTVDPGHNEGKIILPRSQRALPRPRRVLVRTRCCRLRNRLFLSF